MPVNNIASEKQFISIPNLTNDEEKVSLLFAYFGQKQTKCFIDSTVFTQSGQLGESVWLILKRNSLTPAQPQRNLAINVSICRVPEGIQIHLQTSIICFPI